MRIIHILSETKALASLFSRICSQRSIILMCSGSNVPATQKKERKGRFKLLWIILKGTNVTHNIQCKLNKYINATGILEKKQWWMGQKFCQICVGCPLKPTSPSLISTPPDFSQLHFSPSHEPHECRTSPTG